MADKPKIQYAPDTSKEYEGMCEVCGKAMWKRDKEFSLYKFKKVLCANHAGSKHYGEQKLAL